MLDEEEKGYEKAKAAAESKKTGQGKKAKEYDAAEAQRKALIKSMQKMMIGGPGATEEGDDNLEEEKDLIQEVVLEKVVGDQESLSAMGSKQMTSSNKGQY